MIVTKKKSDFLSAIAPLYSTKEFDISIDFRKDLFRRSISNVYKKID
jgi:hypothetical protein